MGTTTMDPIIKIRVAIRGDVVMVARSVEATIATGVIGGVLDVVGDTET